MSALHVGQYCSGENSGATHIFSYEETHEAGALHVSLLCKTDIISMDIMSEFLYLMSPINRDERSNYLMDLMSIWIKFSWILCIFQYLDLMSVSPENFS